MKKHLYITTFVFLLTNVQYACSQIVTHSIGTFEKFKLSPNDIIQKIKNLNL